MTIWARTSGQTIGYVEGREAAQPFRPADARGRHQRRAGG